MKKDKKEKKDKEKEKKSKRSEADFQPQETYSPARPPLEYALSLVGGKWKLRILSALADRKGMRYGEIRQRVEGITDMMLSQSLKGARGRWHDRPHAVPGNSAPSVEYSITKDGASLLPVIELCRVVGGADEKARGIIWTT